MEADDNLRIERLTAFIELANDVLAVPWSKRNATVEWKFESPEGDGRGTWSLVGPSELELKVLALDLRNVTQARSDLYLPRVLEDFAWMVHDEVLRDAGERVLAGFVQSREIGVMIWNDEPLVPWQVAERWFYGWYHHRNLSDRRWLKDLDALSRFSFRAEFLTYLGAVLQTIAEVCNLITFAKERGYLAAVPLADGSAPE